MSVSDLCYYPDDIDTGERMAQCDQCGRTGIVPSEDLLLTLEGWVFASTAEGDVGVAACPDHTIEQSLRWFGMSEGF